MRFTSGRNKMDKMEQVKVSKPIRVIANWQKSALAVLLGLTLLSATCFAVLAATSNDTTGDVATGCVPGSSKSYTEFNADQFSTLDDNITIDPDTHHLTEKTGAVAIDKNKILLTSTQDVRVTLLYEGGAYESDFGYFLLSPEMVEKGYVNETEVNGQKKYTLNYSTLEEHINPYKTTFDKNTFHYIFMNMDDNNDDGILDVFETGTQPTTEENVAKYNDGTEYHFAVNGDGEVTNQDMTKDLGLIAEDQEIVFFLVADGNYDHIYFSKTAFNPDTYQNSQGCTGSPIERVYHLGLRTTNEPCIQDPGWLDLDAIDRLSNQFGIVLSPTDTYTMDFIKGDPFSHLLVGAPANDPTQWILGWEDLFGGGDLDYNDIVFKVQRKTQARAISKVVSTAISSTPGTYITAVNFEAEDRAVNCVSGVVPGPVNKTVDAAIAGTWTPRPDSCVSTKCTAQCTDNDAQVTFDFSNLTLTGDINDDFTQATLTGQARANVELNFDSCFAPSGSSGQCADLLNQPSFPPVRVSVTLSAQNLSVDSEGNFSGVFQFIGDLKNLYNSDNDFCFQNWQGTVSGEITLSGRLHGDWNTRKNDIRYYISVDGGDSWSEISNWDNATTNSDGSEVKKARIDTLSLGLVGNQLKWKAVFENNDANCTAPELDKVNISYDASGNNSFSRADPVVLGNVLYSGSLETPASSWPDKSRLRGHMIATRIYDPTNPNASSYKELWDAGQQLADRDLSTDPRQIYVAMPTPQSVTGETVGTGTADHKVSFSGNLAHGRILAGSVVISDKNGTETFTDSGVNQLMGDKGGTGTLDRFTGRFELTFMNAPDANDPIEASYEYYPDSSDLQVLDDFSASYITYQMLGINDQKVSGAGLTYDFDDNGKFGEGDKQYLIDWVEGIAHDTGGNKYQRTWPLGAIDHSTPAVVGPPGLPAWYYGADVSQTVRDAYDSWAKALATRRTVLYVGADDGMLHAFDAGAFRQGDNPATPFVENRGYFASTQDKDDNTVVNYGTGKELWAFIPNNCISRLKYLYDKSLPNADPPYVDASPSVEDVYYYDAENQLHFKTILFCAEGRGGDTIFALDVTDPEHPKFMWEYGNPALWRSKSSPPVGKIVRLNNGGKPRWVVFFVSGQTSADQSPAIFMVDALTGQLIKQIVLNLTGVDNEGDVLSGSPAVVDANGNGYVDRLYVGDNKGIMYRVNIPDNSDYALDPDTIQTCELVQVSEPIYASPSVYPMDVYDSSGQISQYHVKVMFGTGDNPNFNDNPNYAGTNYKFYVFDDTCAPAQLEGGKLVMKDGSGTGQCNCVPMQTEADAEWSWALPEGQRIWATAFAAANSVYFGTSASDTQDPCAESTDSNGTGGSIYSLNLNDLSSTSAPTTLASDVGNVSGMTVEDQHLYVKTTNPSSGTTLSSFGGNTYNNPVAIGVTFESQKLLGSWQQIFH